MCLARNLFGGRASAKTESHSLEGGTKTLISPPVEIPREKYNSIFLIGTAARTANGAKRGNEGGESTLTRNILPEQKELS